MYQSIPGTDYFEASFVITRQTGTFQHCPIVGDIFILSVLLYPCPATWHGQEEQEQETKKCIDKLEKVFSLCSATRIFEIICKLGEKEKTPQLSTSLSHFMLTILFDFYFSTNFWILNFHTNLKIEIANLKRQDNMYFSRYFTVTQEVWVTSLFFPERSILPTQTQSFIMRLLRCLNKVWEKSLPGLRPVITNLVETSHISYTKIKAGIIFSVTTLTSFLLFTPSFFLLIIFSDISGFQFFACEGMKRPEEGRQSLERKKADARKRCLKFSKKSIIQLKEESFYSESGNSPWLSTQKEPWSWMLPLLTVVFN